MTKSPLLLTATALLLAAPAAESQVRVREYHFHPIARPETTHTIEHSPRLRAATEALRTETHDLDKLKLYPVAGDFGSDIFVPYFVDVDPGPISERDFRCLDYTFDGHTGHDPYIRSFREQEIGVPVFAPLDGTILAVHDGEPDQNTDSNPNRTSNSIILSHVAGYRTEYMHLKRNSITVQEGQFVTAGTQIAMVGSSGESAAPHLHWDVRVNGTPVEPMSGPCRTGESLFELQPSIENIPSVIGIAFSDARFANYEIAPYDNAPRRATYVRGTDDVNLRVEVANVRAGDRYTLTITPPNGEPMTAASGELTAYTAYLASASWALDVPLTQSGTWTVTLRVNDHRVVENVPFTVVDSFAEIVNRAPNTPQVSLEPIALRAGEVAVCRADPGLLADPDTDVVSYRYEWRVNEQLIRDVTTAVRSDALARQFLTPGAVVSCTVTLSDGQASSQPAVTHADVGGAIRRRAVGRR